MKIVSRPTTAVAGSGAYTIKIDIEELQFIAALTYVTRLGRGSIYREAAHKLMNTMEEMFDADFVEEASGDVDLSISIVDSSDTILEQHHYSSICLEV